MDSGARVAPWDSEALVARSSAAVGTSTDESSLWRTAEAKRAETHWARHSERALQNNPAFRKQQANVERTLARFESVNEWADFIAFLARLLKVIQADRQFNAIPHKLTVAKRLSQCLNPALPSGVHTRAIEVYALIFETIGPDGLRRDLQVWSPGLLPFFAHAATSVRPAVLALFDRFYVPLSVDLRPLTRALLLSLLPGLEEENGEFFDHVVRLLDHISASVGTAFFLQNIWLVLISSPAVRLPALHYLARRMPQLTETTARDLLAPDPGLLVRGIAHALDDELLVRRHALDFVITHVALSSFVVRAVLSEHDRVILMDAVLGCVLRRDLSLNRRVYAWLLGPDGTEAYFEQHALALVTHALRRDVAAPAQAQRAAQRPYKIFITLLDKRAIGAPLVNALALEMFMWSTRQSASPEMRTTSQMLFDAIDDDQLYQLVYQALCDRRADAVELCSNILKITNNHTDEARTVHFPALLLALVDSSDDVRSEHSLALVAQLSEALSAQALLPLHNGDAPASLGECAALVFSDKQPVAPLQNRTVALRLVERLLALALDRCNPTAIHALSVVIGTISATKDDVYAGLIPDNAFATGTIKLQQFNGTLFRALEQSPFPIFDALLRIALAISATPVIPGEFALVNLVHLHMLVHRLIVFLDPASSTQHEALGLFWELKHHVRHDLVTPILCDALSTHDQRIRRASLRAFGSLWRFSDDTSELHVPVLLVLDRLRSPDPIVKHEGIQWLRDYVTSYKPLVYMLLERAAMSGARRQRIAAALDGRTLEIYEYDAPFEQEQLNYALATLVALLASGGSRIFARFMDERINIPGMDEGPIIDVLRDFLTLLIRTEPSKALAASMDDANVRTVAQCLEIIHVLIATLDLPLEWYAPVENALVDVLLYHIQDSAGHKELVLLTLLQVLNARVHAAGTESLDDDGCAHMADLVRRGTMHATDVSDMGAWTDFATGLLPLAGHALSEYLVPVVSTLSELVCHGVTQLAKDNGHGVSVLQSVFAPKTTISGRSYSENALLHLLDTAERALSRALDVQEEQDRDVSVGDAEPQSSGGILGNLSSVLVSSDTPAPTPMRPWPQQLVRACALYVHTMQYTWLASFDALTLGDEAFSCLDNLYRRHANIVVDAVVHTWATAEDRAVVETHSFQTVEALSSSAQIITTFLADTITSRAGGRKGQRATEESEETLFAFLNAYVAHVDATTATLAWPVLVLLARDIMATHSTSKPLVTAALRLITTASNSVLQTPSADDRRVRRDMHECFCKLFELALGLYGRVDIAVLRKDEAVHDVLALLEYIAYHVLPTLSKLRIDSDKATALCTTVVNNVLVPEFRARGKNVDVDDLALDLLVSMSSVPDTYKAWRSVVNDAFMEPRFFALPLHAASRWAKIVTSWLASDRERLIELITRVTSTTGNIFASREADNIARVLNIRRLSFAIFAGGRDAYLLHLPLIQEKLVEILRSAPAEIVQAEVYMCMRVLLFRFTSQHLSGFWPIIVTELLRIFDQVRDEIPPDESDALCLLVSVSKLADLLLTLQTEDFQIHQWLLITDTPDSIYPLPDWSSDALLDCIGKTMAHEGTGVHEPIEVGALRRPLIQKSHITSAADLEPFFANASACFYKSEYASAQLDWENIASCLLRDIFDPDRVARK